MAWEKEINELNDRLEMVKNMGGEEGIRRQHENGKLTVRERISKIADPGSFNEHSALAGSALYEENSLTDLKPYPRVIGSAKPRPAPGPLLTNVLIPITSPLDIISGPPEFPGFIAASV